MKRPSRLEKELKQVRGPAAARLRKGKYQLTERYRIPKDLLPGSVSVSYVRCGKPRCRCVSGEKHASWTWTFMVDGKKRTEHVSADQVDLIQEHVRAGREFQDAVREVLAANAELLVLGKRQRGRGKTKPSR